MIFKSIKKTGKLLVIESAWRTCSISAEIISRVSEKCFDSLKMAPQRITLPEIPTPTSHVLTKFYYPGVKEIYDKACTMIRGVEFISLEIDDTQKHDDNQVGRR